MLRPAYTEKRPHDDARSVTTLAVVAFGAQGPLRTQRARLLFRVEPPTRSPSLVTFSADGQARQIAAEDLVRAEE